MINYTKFDGVVVNEDFELINGEKSKYAIVYHMDSEKLFYLNETALEIFNYCNSAKSMSAIHKKIAECYELENGDSALIDECIEELIFNGLLIGKENE